ncbi:MAG TPA: conjugal transfer protein TraD [Caulobacteraceae bacterium]|jgi:hypothetical protein|nr:conjugal transfer protein TraD [Caulobacteraceae bacterium]
MRRAEAAHARQDEREWAVERRARTRQLIELGGLVQKAGLVDLLKGDRAALYGGLLELAYQLQADQDGRLPDLWRRRGRRAFQADASDAAHGPP